MTNIIIIKIDSDSEMAAVYLNSILIMEGNFWDFHPRCYGIYQYGDFNSYDQLAKQVSVMTGDCEIKTEAYTY